MGMRMPETCWAVFKRQVVNLRNWCIWLIDSVENMECRYSFTLRPHYLQIIYSWYSLNRPLGGLHSLSGRFDEEEDLCPPRWSNHDLSIIQAVTWTPYRLSCCGCLFLLYADLILGWDLATVFQLPQLFRPNTAARWIWCDYAGGGNIC